MNTQPANPFKVRSSSALPEPMLLWIERYTTIDDTDNNSALIPRYGHFYLVQCVIWESVTDDVADDFVNRDLKISLSLLVHPCLVSGQAHGTRYARDFAQAVGDTETVRYHRCIDCPVSPMSV